MWTLGIIFTENAILALLLVHSSQGVFTTRMTGTINCSHRRNLSGAVKLKRAEIHTKKCICPGSSNAKIAQTSGLKREVNVQKYNFKGMRKMWNDWFFLIKHCTNWKGFLCQFIKNRTKWEEFLVKLTCFINIGSSLWCKINKTLYKPLYTYIFSDSDLMTVLFLYEIRNFAGGFPIQLPSCRPVKLPWV